MGHVPVIATASTHHAQARSSPRWELISEHYFVRITGSVLVIILQGNIFVELRTNLYLCRRRLISWGEYGTTVKEEKRNGNLPCDGQRHQPSGHL